MKINPIQQELQRVALEAQSSTMPINGQKVAQDFDQLLTSAINHVNGLQKSSGELATRFDMGDRSVTLSDVMIARNKASVAFEATIQTRNKLVDAYKELMNMPV